MRHVHNSDILSSGGEGKGGLPSDISGRFEACIYLIVHLFLDDKCRYKPYRQHDDGGREVDQPPGQD